MRLSLDPEGVTGYLPDPAAVLDDSRLRPTGVVGGLAALAVAALLQVGPLEPLVSVSPGGTFALVGVGLLAVGLAAPEPADEDAVFHIGVDLNWIQRRVVAGGAAGVVVSPMLVAVLGPAVGFADWVWLLAAVVAFLGSVLILTGFVAWSSRAIAQPSGIQ